MSLPTRCGHCDGRAAYPDEDGVQHCLICGRTVGENGDNHQLDPAKVDGFMQQAPGAFRSLRAAVPESLDFDLE